VSRALLPPIANRIATPTVVKNVMATETAKHAAATHTRYVVMAPAAKRGSAVMMAPA
jgi:hypothetical protein